MKSGRYFLLLVVLAMRPCLAQTVDAPWFKGQLHCHSYWSDGRGFPEQAVQAYQQRGYHFVSITDHNRFADDPAQWRTVEEAEGEWPPHVTRAIYDAYVRDFGDWVDSKTEGDIESVRLKTYEELKGKFDVPGEFLLMAGVEITQELPSLSAHLTYANLPRLIPALRNVELMKRFDDPTVTASGVMASNVSEVSALASELRRPTLLAVAHPHYNFDIMPQDFVDNPTIRFFEVYNNGEAVHPDATSYTLEKLWDVVNAFRSVNGQLLLYGTATDDAHFYDPDRIEGFAGAGHGWVMVRAATLTPEAVLAAMHQGDFYATTGVYLDELMFDAKENRLQVKVKPEDGVTYRIRFITTSANFDQSITHVQIDKPARTLPLYSEDIGRVAMTVSGTEASYTLEPDDLFVRARIESDRPSRLVGDPARENLQPRVQIAWTQPYVRGRD